MDFVVAQSSHVKGKLLAIRRPIGRTRALGQISNLHQIASVEVLHPDVPGPATIGVEGNVFAIGRELRGTLLPRGRDEFDGRNIWVEQVLSPDVGVIGGNGVSEFVTFRGELARWLPALRRNGAATRQRGGPASSGPLSVSSLITNRFPARDQANPAGKFYFCDRPRGSAKTSKSVDLKFAKVAYTEIDKAVGCKRKIQVGFMQTVRIVRDGGDVEGFGRQEKHSVTGSVWKRIIERDPLSIG